MAKEVIPPFGTSENLHGIQDYGYTEPPHRCAIMIQEIMKKMRRKVTLIIVVDLDVLDELLQDKLGSLLRRKFCDTFVYASE